MGDRTFRNIVFIQHLPVAAAVLAFSVFSSVAFASPKANQSKGRALASAGSHEVEKPLVVRGQTRNLSMMLVLKNEKDKIKFGEIRENYRNEVLGTNY